jgi:hypothetical protein
VTKKIHNALQGGGINLTDQKMRIFEEVAYENAQRLHLDHDVVVVHDPQPLPLIRHYRKKAPWIWRCHLDLSEPDPDMWRYIASFVESYDAVILSLPDYGRSIGPPQLFFAPAIDPFSLKNKELDEHEIDERIAHYGIPQDVPLVVQISRFDSWKDPKGVVEAAKIVMKETPCTLVLLGNVATDDPEGQTVFESIQQSANERIIVLSCQDTALVNALQRRAAVVVQKSLREGFGLTVTEAMWKGRPVVGGDAGGIRHQIDDGVNGFLVSTVARPGFGPAAGRKGPRTRAPALSDAAPDGTISRPFCRVRGAFSGAKDVTWWRYSKSGWLNDSLAAMAAVEIRSPPRRPCARLSGPDCVTRPPARVLAAIRSRRAHRVVARRRRAARARAAQQPGDPAQS